MNGCKKANDHENVNDCGLSIGIPSSFYYLNLIII